MVMGNLERKFDMSTLTALYRYPVKSCAAESLSHAEVEPLGLAFDRRWMLVDSQTGRCITGREAGQLVLLRTRILANQLWLECPGFADLRPVFNGPRRDVQVWDSTVNAAIADMDCNGLLSAWLQRSVQLVYFDSLSTRALDPKYAQPGDETAFSDGFPLLLISQVSLDHLNSKLPQALPMTRFRPNLVVTGKFAAHEEDTWQRIRIGEAQFDLVKPCIRCVFTTVMPDSGQRDPSGEPLKTLAQYRRSPKGISFGMNVICRTPRVKVNVGDAVQVLPNA
jgi:uncharacterized protein